MVQPKGPAGAPQRRAGQLRSAGNPRPPMWSHDTIIRPHPEPPPQHGCPV